MAAMTNSSVALHKRALVLAASLGGSMLALGSSCAPVCRGVDGACLDVRVEGSGSYSGYAIEWRYAISEEPLAALRRGATEEGGELPRTFRVLPPPGVDPSRITSIGVLGLSADASEQASGSIEIANLGADEHRTTTLPLGLRVTRSDINLSANGADLLAADLNGDSIQDLAVVGTPAMTTSNSLTGGVLSVLYGLGDGTYRLPQTFAIAAQAMSVKVADVNGDGLPDLLTGGAGDSFSLFHNTGNSAFGSRIGIPNTTGITSGDCASGSDTHSVAVADV
jgi:hypothetical protein